MKKKTVLYTPAPSFHPTHQNIQIRNFYILGWILGWNFDNCKAWQKYTCYLFILVGIPVAIALDLLILVCNLVFKLVFFIGEKLIDTLFKYFFSTSFIIFGVVLSLIIIYRYFI